MHLLYFSFTLNYLCQLKCQIISLFFQQLIENLDRDLEYAIRVEGKMDIDSVSNYDEVKDAIMEKVIVNLVFYWSIKVLQ